MNTILYKMCDDWISHLTLVTYSNCSGKLSEPACEKNGRLQINNTVKQYY